MKEPADSIFRIEECYVRVIKYLTTPIYFGKKIRDIQGCTAFLYNYVIEHRIFLL
jgi:hypothetical protein